MSKAIKFSVILLGIFLLLTCTVFPTPKEATDSLIIGTFSLDFPDRFFDQSPRSFTSGIQLSFADTSTNTTFGGLTSQNGLFVFLGKGNSQCVLKGFSIEVQIHPMIYTINDKMNLKFECTPGKIMYLGNIKITYKLPEANLSTGSSRTWNYKVSVSVTNTKEQILNMIRAMDKKGYWANSEIDDRYAQ